MFSWFTPLHYPNATWPEEEYLIKAQRRISELNDELMTTYRSHDFKTDDLDDTCTRLQHAQDELVAA
jgi:hypothetical protein